MSSRESRLSVSSMTAISGPVVVGVGDRPYADVSRDLDLLVCGSRGGGPLRSVLLGSVTERLLRSAACPVVIVPPHRRTGTESTSA